MKVVDIAKTIDPHAQLKTVGVRPGEKLHEQMISVEDAPNTFDCGSYFKILPNPWGGRPDERETNYGERVPNDFVYASDSNNEWMSTDTLQDWILKNVDGEGAVPLK